MCGRLSGGTSRLRATRGHDVSRETDLHGVRPDTAVLGGASLAPRPRSVALRNLRRKGLPPERLSRPDANILVRTPSPGRRIGWTSPNDLAVDAEMRSVPRHGQVRRAHAAPSRPRHLCCQRAERCDDGRSVAPADTASVMSCAVRSIKSPRRLVPSAMASRDRPTLAELHDTSLHDTRFARRPGATSVKTCLVR